MMDFESWIKDQDMLFFLGERDGKAGDYNSDYAWSESYKNGFYEARMMTMSSSGKHQSQAHLDNY